MGHLDWRNWVGTGILTVAAGAFSVGAVATDRPILRATNALFGAVFGVWGTAASAISLLDTAKRAEAARRTRNERFLLACE